MHNLADKGEQNSVAVRHSDTAMMTGLDGGRQTVPAAAYNRAEGSAVGSVGVAVDNTGAAMPGLSVDRYVVCLYWDRYSDQISPM